MYQQNSWKGHGNEGGISVRGKVRVEGKGGRGGGVGVGGLYQVATAGRHGTHSRPIRTPVMFLRMKGL